MKCPQCNSSINPLFDSQRLRCPNCESNLVDLNAIFQAEELETFESLINEAMNDSQLVEKLSHQPASLLQERGISQASLDQLALVLGHQQNPFDNIEWDNKWVIDKHNPDIKDISIDSISNIPQVHVRDDITSIRRGEIEINDFGRLGRDLPRISDFDAE